MSTDSTVKQRKLGVWSWAFYDWANSAFTTVIMTFIFAKYIESFAGTVQWTQMLMLSGLAIAILAPILGSIADHGGKRKPWLFVLTWTMGLLTCCLWFVEPDESFVPMALLLVGIANICFELGVAFNNSMLSDLVEEEQIGRWSGWAWGIGYVGGLLILVLCLVFIKFGDPASLGLDTNKFEHIRIMGPIVGIWVILFSLPLFVFTPDKPSTGKSAMQAVSLGLTTLWQTMKSLREYKNIAVFLLGRMFYADGLATLFTMGGIFAAKAYGMSDEEVLTFAIILNITAGAGAIAFAWIDDIIGSKNTIVISVSAIILLGSFLLFFEEKTTFYILAALLGIFIGPAQSASRALMARLAPNDMQTEMFGLYAFSGKATAFIAPAIVTIVMTYTDNIRLGMAIIPVLMLIGLVIILRVKEPARSKP
jgi:MFS transporter, UMF1 family